VTYSLPGSMNLASRKDHQVVQIAALNLQSEFYQVATPVLGSFVYREAEIANDSEIPLLDGPVATYLDGRFVGSGSIPLVARGQKFRAGFGINSQLRAARELTDKRDLTMGGNRQQTMHYRLTLENFSDRPVTVRLFDRIPNAMDDAELRVTHGEMSAELSQDALYREREYPHGILRWDVEVAANAGGAAAHALEYEYTLEFDRELVLVTAVEAGKEESVREQFQQLNRKRHRAN
jgi:uncharacterized protein (TIGR02231 family)